MGRFKWLEMPGSEPLKGLPEDKEFDERSCLEIADESLFSGNPEKALRLYARALGINPGLEEAWFGQVQALLDLDEVREARTWANKGLDIFPRFPDLLAAKAVALARLSDTEEALKVSDACMNLKNQDWYVWLSRGYVLLCKGEDSAAHCLNKGLEDAPGDWRRNLRAAILSLDAFKPHLALPFIQKALSGAGENAYVLYQAGRCYEALQWSGQGQEYYEKASRRISEIQPLCIGGAKRLRHQGLGARLNQWIKGWF
jgi:tetratricopeptide (TPR) repeat protein